MQKKKSGAKTSIFPQRKLLIGKSLIKHTFNAQRAVNLSFSTSNSYIAGYQLIVSLKKLDLNSIVCSFCRSKENYCISIVIYFYVKKTKKQKKKKFGSSGPFSLSSN